MHKQHIDIYSCGLYSNWAWYHPFRCLFDLGSGFALHARNFIYGVESVLLTHGHGDHISDLVNFIGIRNSARGAKDKELAIYYPYDSKQIKSYKDFIKHHFGDWLTFKINWFPIAQGHKIEIDSNHYIECFAMAHQKNALTLGYKICEVRTRLKSRFTGQNIPELLKSGLDKKELNEQYIANLFSYCLDNYEVNPEDIRDAELAILDANFLNPADRDDNTHATAEEAIKLAKFANIKNVLLAHVSSRYSINDIKNFAKSLDTSVMICPNDRVINI